MSQPLFTVLIPNFYHERYGERRDDNLKKCLDSLRGQIFNDIEVIILGDEYRSEFRNIVVDMKDLSMGKLFNAGIKESYGQYIQLSQPDFIFEIDHFLKLKDRIHPKVVNCFKIVDEGGHKCTKRNDRIVTDYNIADGMDTLFYKSTAPKFEEGFIGVFSHYLPFFILCLMRSGMAIHYLEDFKITHLGVFNIFDPGTHTEDCVYSNRLMKFLVGYIQLQDSIMEEARDFMGYYREILIKESLKQILGKEK